MEKISYRKQLSIIKLYFRGMSYREIASRTAISTGAVANVISDLKDGRYPEAADIGEQIDMLKELGTEVKESGLSIAEAASGLAVMSSLKELGIEPVDIPRCLSLYKTLTPPESDTKIFVRAAMTYAEIVKRTGLEAAELEQKVKNLEEAANQLKPMASKKLKLQEVIKEYERKSKSLSAEAETLEKRQKTLNEGIRLKEERETELSTHAMQIEAKLQIEMERLTAARKDLKTLAGIGLNLNDLSGIAERLAGIAHRHEIKPHALLSRLLLELEQLDKGLKLDTQVDSKHRDLRQVGAEIIKAEQKIAALNDQKKQLQQELISLQIQISREREQVSSELKEIVTTAQAVVTDLKCNLGEGVNDAIKEVATLTNEALKTGNELGQFNMQVQSNAWLRDIHALLSGDINVDGNRVRSILLTLLNSFQGWQLQHPSADTIFDPLKIPTDSLIRELQQWKPMNSDQSSQSLTTN